jgi:TonB family protein
MTERRIHLFAELRRIVTSAGLAAGLVCFLVGMRLVRNQEEPLVTLHTLSTAPPVSLPAPPPPPQESEPPPPPPPDLPHLKIELDPTAPAVKASLEAKPELRLNRSEFAPETDAPLAQMTFSSVDLDSQPRLVNKPTVNFPASQRRLGVTEAKVVLEVLIGANGAVTVKRVLESPHDDFTSMARSFATRARFTPPKKDGRAVNALFRWPLLLKS